MGALHNQMDILIHFLVKELEHTWRVKFPDCKEFVYKHGVDQMIVIVDMKGSKLKDITNK
jgi:soluble cytochrome b562